MTSGTRSSSLAIIAVVLSSAARAVDRASQRLQRAHPRARAPWRAVHRRSVPAASRDAANPVASPPRSGPNPARTSPTTARRATATTAAATPNRPQPVSESAGHAPARHAEKTDGELYWIIENGIRLTGMPAWGKGGQDDMDTWKLVHFIRRLKDLTPEQLKEMERPEPQVSR